MAILNGTVLAWLATGDQAPERSSSSTPAGRPEANATVNAAMAALRQGDDAMAIPALREFTATGTSMS
ncbi:MAG: hypothetical protein ABSF71_06185 [Terriglobia bacterium]